MNRITNAGKGFIKLDNELLNLQSVKSIKKQFIGQFEDPEDKDRFSIAITPMQATPDDIEHGSDGTYHITYKEENQRDNDFKIIEEAIANQ